MLLEDLNWAEPTFLELADYLAREATLIRMAAYQSIAREDRAVLHERFADWLGRTSPHSTAEFHEVLGYHLAQAMDTVGQAESAEPPAPRRSRAERSPADRRGPRIY